MPKLDLDTIDCRIVTELQADARLSNVELAERVGLSPSPCLRRVSVWSATATSSVIGPRSVGSGSVSDSRSLSA